MSREEKAVGEGVSRGSLEGVRDRKRTPSEPGLAGEGSPNPELVERPRRRRFSAEYKLGVLREADACREPGEVGALLRREGLYTSHLSAWRKQRDKGALASLSRKRGRRGRDPRDVELERLRRRLARSEAALVKAKKVIEVQGNVSALLGKMLGTEGAEESTES